MWAKNLPVCRKDQQEMRRTATQFSDNHHQTSHGGRRTDIATVETKKASYFHKKIGGGLSSEALAIKT